jgi:regulatory protein
MDLQDKQNNAEKPEIAIRRAAMDLLARREHSFKELVQKLSVRFSEEAIYPALKKLKDENLQSDQRYLEAYVRFRRNKGFGPLKIEAELYGKGLDSEQVKACLYSEENDWQELCQQALEKRFPVLNVDNVKERAKCERFLLQRGFPHDSIKMAIKSNLNI